MFLHSICLNQPTPPFCCLTICVFPKKTIKPFGNIFNSLSIKNTWTWWCLQETGLPLTTCEVVLDRSVAESARARLVFTRSAHFFKSAATGTSSWGCRPRSSRPTASWSARRSSRWSGSRARTSTSSCLTRQTKSRKRSAENGLTFVAHKFSWLAFAHRFTITKTTECN